MGDPSGRQPRGRETGEESVAPILQRVFRLRKAVDESAAVCLSNNIIITTTTAFYLSF